MAMGCRLRLIDLLRYARYLGIDPVADHDLLWIAVEARFQQL